MVHFIKRKTIAFKTKIVTYIIHLHKFNNLIVIHIIYQAFSMK